MHRMVSTKLEDGGPSPLWLLNMPLSSMAISILIVGFTALLVHLYPPSEFVRIFTNPKLVKDELLARASAMKLLLDLFFASWIYNPLELKPEPKDLEGKVALVTGSNVGIGYSTAHLLLNYGCTVILACRDLRKAKEAREGLLFSMQLRRPDLWFAGGRERVILLEDAACDLSDLESVRKFASALASELAKRNKEGKRGTIDYLINNAGMVPHVHGTSKQGHEITYATNMLGAFLLTHLLLTLMSEDGRVVQCSSGALYFARAEHPGHHHESRRRSSHRNGTSSSFPANGIATLHERKSKRSEAHKDREMSFYESMALYASSKAQQAMFTITLQERLSDGDHEHSKKNISVHACHPGLVTSTIWKRYDTTASWLRTTIMQLSFITSFTVRWFGIREEQGALNLVWLATAEKPHDPKHRGQFWDRMKRKHLPVSVTDRAVREATWAMWERDSGVISQ